MVELAEGQIHEGQVAEYLFARQQRCDYRLADKAYDGHTFSQVFDQINRISRKTHQVKQVFVDLDCRTKVKIKDIDIYHEKLRTDITERLKTDIKRRSAIEPHVGHIKSDGKLGRNQLKGGTRNTIDAVLCGCGHNIHMILRKLRASLFCLFIFVAFE